MQLELLNEQGQAASKVDAPDTVFGRDYNEALVHQVVVAYQANARQGTRAQKDRATVKHSTTKPWRQKGTGRARAGSSQDGVCRAAREDRLRGPASRGPDSGPLGRQVLDSRTLGLIEDRLKAKAGRMRAGLVVLTAPRVTLRSNAASDTGTTCSMSFQSRKQSRTHAHDEASHETPASASRSCERRPA